MESPVETSNTDTVASVQKEQLTAEDSENVKTVDHGEQLETTPIAVETYTAENRKSDTGSSSPTLPLDSETTKGLTPSTDTTIEKVIGEISYSECSDEPQNETTLEGIPLNVTSMQPIETYIVASEMPEFSHTLDTTLRNSSSRSSPPPPPMKYHK